MELVTTYLCKISDIGVHSNMFGGNLVALIDQSSAAYASQICDTPRMVTLSINEMLFKRPIKVGNIIKVYAKVLEFGNTSVTLYIEIRKHNVYTGEQDIAMSTTIRFVRVDDEGNSLPISDRVKQRYYKRINMFGKGLLDMEEKKLEMDREGKKPEQIAAEDKALAIIESCTICDHFDNAEQYLELFKIQFSDEQTYDTLVLALKSRKEMLICK